MTEDEWEQRFDELWDDLHDTNQVVFIGPEQPYKSHRYLGATGSYAGAMQAHTNYDNLISWRRIEGFSTLHERVESADRSLKAI